jgi:hypothetical protein
MRKIRFWAGIGVAALTLVGIGGWANSNHRTLEAQASTGIGAARLDAFQMMLSAKDLPIQEVEDFSFVFSSSLGEGRTTVTP